MNSDKRQDAAIATTFAPLPTRSAAELAKRRKKDQVSEQFRGMMKTQLPSFSCFGVASCAAETSSRSRAIVLMHERKPPSSSSPIPSSIQVRQLKTLRCASGRTGTEARRGESACETSRGEPRLERSASRAARMRREDNPSSSGVSSSYAHLPRRFATCHTVPLNDTGAFDGLKSGSEGEQLNGRKSTQCREAPLSVPWTRAAYSVFGLKATADGACN